MTIGNTVAHLDRLLMLYKVKILDFIVNTLGLTQFDILIDSFNESTFQYELRYGQNGQIFKQAEYQHFPRWAR